MQATRETLNVLAIPHSHCDIRTCEGMDAEAERRRRPGGRTPGKVSLPCPCPSTACKKATGYKGHGWPACMKCRSTFPPTLTGTTKTLAGWYYPGTRERRHRCPGSASSLGCRRSELVNPSAETGCLKPCMPSHGPTACIYGTDSATRPTSAALAVAAVQAGGAAIHDDGGVGVALLAKRGACREGSFGIVFAQFGLNRRRM